MSPETKQQALGKLATFNPKVGYPDKGKDYSNVEIERVSHWDNGAAGFEGYFMEPGIHHNGKLVLGESIGDLDGAKVGPVSNLPEFAETFGCAPAAAMVRPDGKRGEVW